MSLQCLLSGLPDRQTKRDLVHEVGKIVHKNEGCVLYGARQVSEEVAHGVNGPTGGYNDEHGTERSLQALVDFFVASRNLARFAKKDFKQDEEPASHADSETSPGVHDLQGRCD